MRLKKMFGIASLIGSLLYSGIASGATLRKYIYPAHDSTSTIGMPVAWWVNNGASDTLYSTVNPLYSAGVPTNNFLWPPVAGDTIHSKDSLQVGSDVYTGHMRSIYQGGNLTLPPGFIDDPNKPVKAYTFGIWKVKDPQGIGTIRGEGWLNKNPSQKIPFWNFVRNADTLDLTFPDGQFYINTECQDSLWQQGDSVTIRLYSQKDDTLWESDTTFALDTLKHGSATMLDSLIFPERIIIGVAEENLEKRVRETGKLIIKPNPAKSYVISTHEAYLYDALGRRVKKIDKGKNTLDLNSGVYFIKKEDDIEKLVIYK